MKNKSFETILYSTVGVAAMALILVAFNFITGSVKTRVDLTKEKAYTLSAGTRAILSKLDAPVKVRFYCTQGENSTPGALMLKNYAKEVEDLLGEYKQAAKGKIIIEKYNPEPDSDAEDSAHLDGVEGASDFRAGVDTCDRGACCFPLAEDQALRAGPARGYEQSHAGH
jgi:ABC-type uncharacterized transport system involved in gliding motility auxiliary subunit